MKNPKFIILIIFFIFSISLVLSLNLEEIERVFSEDNTIELLERSSVLERAGKIEEAIDLHFEVWKMNRATVAHLLMIGCMYNKINDPEMAGRFLLEFAKRDITGGNFNQEALKENFINVWNDETFIEYRDKAISIAESKHKKKE